MWMYIHRRLQLQLGVQLCVSSDVLQCQLPNNLCEPFSVWVVHTRTQMQKSRATNDARKLLFLPPTKTVSDIAGFVHGSIGLEMWGTVGFNAKDTDMHTPNARALYVGQG